MSDRYVDLTKGEADIALRSGDTDDEQLVSRKIADSIWAVYASKSYVARNGKPDRVEDINRHAVIGLDESMANHRAAKWLAQVAPDAKIAARNNSMLGVVYAVKSGISLAPLPTAVGDAEDTRARSWAYSGTSAQLALADAAGIAQDAAVQRSSISS